MRWNCRRLVTPSKESFVESKCIHKPSPVSVSSIGGRAALDAIAHSSYDVMGGAPRARRRDFARRYFGVLFAPKRVGAQR